MVTKTMVSKELLEELELIVFEEYGIKLNKKEVSEFGTVLLGFFDLLIKIDKQENYGTSK